MKKGVFPEEVTLHLGLKRYAGIGEKVRGNGPEPLLAEGLDGTKVRN